MWTYMLRCRDGSYYTGWTNDLAGRVAAHGAGRGAKYTRGRGPVRLVWAQRCKTKNEAMRREVAVKALTRAEKQELVHGWDARTCLPAVLLVAIQDLEEPT